MLWTGHLRRTSPHKAIPWKHGWHTPNVTPYVNYTARTFTLDSKEDARRTRKERSRQQIRHVKERTEMLGGIKVAKIFVFCSIIRSNFLRGGFFLNPPFSVLSDQSEVRKDWVENNISRRPKRFVCFDRAGRGEGVCGQHCWFVPFVVS